MLIVGAKGHAKEVRQCLNKNLNVCFYDDINEDYVLGENIKIIKNLEDAKQHFRTENKFIVGIGNPKLRRFITDKFIEIGGVLTSVIADTAVINESAYLGEGLNIMHFSFISSNVIIGRGSLINCRASLHHDVSIGEFCEISPGAILLGNCEIGDNVFIGAGAVVLPGIKIGYDAVIGAGAVVTKDVLPSQTVVGVPANLIKLK